jgi:hypothetical protein
VIYLYDIVCVLLLGIFCVVYNVVFSTYYVVVLSSLCSLTWRDVFVCCGVCLMTVGVLWWVVGVIYELGSSVSIVSGYGLDDRAIEVRSPAGAKNISCSLCVQTGSGAHPASCTIGTRGPFPGANARPGRNTDHSPLSSAEVENE